MPHYLILFNQQWVGDHPPEWFASRGPLARAVVEEIRQAGAYVFAGGVDEDVASAYSADPTGGEVVIAPGRYSQSDEYLGGLTIVDVPDEQAALVWAARIAEACGWPQEVRRVIP
jgi:hypothetical protein